MGKDDLKESASSPPGRSTPWRPVVALPLRPDFWGKCLALIVLSASLLISFSGWYLARNITIKRANDRFDSRVKMMESSIREHLQAYEFLLQGGVALFAVSDEVTRQDWRTYVTMLRVNQYYPGIQGVGFSKHILPSEKEAHIRGVRDEGFPGYDIQPEGARPEYTAIIFLEPFDWRNQRAFGYDMYSEPVRKKAMSRARDTGLAALSGRVTLVQETVTDLQAGFLMYLPVYRKGKTPETPEQRHEALRGYVYSPFRMNDFMRGILSAGQGYVELHIFDGDKPLKETLLFHGGATEGSISKPIRTRFATRQSILEYAGHRWLLVFESSAHFEKVIDTGSVTAALWLGIIISLLLFAVVSFLSRSRNQAVSLANMSLDRERIIAELREEVMERKRAEEERARLNANLEMKNNELEQMIYVVSHDLRSPLVNIDGYSKELGYAIQNLHRVIEVTSAGGTSQALALLLEQDIPEALRFIRISASKMDMLLTGLLRLSRLGRAALKTEVLNMNRLITKVIDATEFIIKQAQVKLELADLPPCRGDAVQVSQIFSNLLDNALKHLDPHRPGVIRITGWIDEKRSVYCVEDNGIGIASAHLDKIFELFHRLDPAQQVEGDGLGLTIVKRIAGRMGGAVWAESEVGSGSRFYVVLPAELPQL